MEITAVPFGDEAISALRESIARVKGGDALAPVTVIVPSAYAGLSLRRALGRDGLVNVGFMPIARLAELAGAPALARANRRPLTPAIRAEAVRRALSARPGFFQSVRDHASTERSLDATFRELRDCDEAAVETLERGNERQQSVAALYRSFRSLTSSYYDASDLADSASRAVRDGGAELRDIGHVIVFLPRQLSAAQASLVSAFSSTGGATVLLGIAGDRQADGETALLAHRLGGEFAVPAVRASFDCDRTRIVTATDPDEELRAVVRQISAAVERGTPLHRIGILYRAQEPYTTLIHERLLAAEIPHHGPGTTTLAESIAGRALLAMLRLPLHDFRRDEVLDWLTSAPVRETEGGGPAPAQRWDVLSRAAGVTAGDVAWGPRLEGHARSLEDRATDIRSGARDEDEPWRAVRLDEDAASTRSLRDFVAGLRTDLSAQRTTYAGYADWTLELLGRYLGKRLWEPNARADAGSVEREHWDVENDYLDDIRDVVQGLAGLDTAFEAPSGAITLAVFVRALESALSARGSRLGPFGDGVFVGPLAVAVGMSFDIVFVVGMVEGQMPPVGREDPLLPDTERRAVDAGDAAAVWSPRAGAARLACRPGRSPSACTPLSPGRPSIAVPEPPDAVAARGGGRSRRPHDIALGGRVSRDVGRRTGTGTRRLAHARCVVHVGRDQ